MKKFWRRVGVFLGVAVIGLSFGAGKASAYTNSRLMNDSVFDRVGSMNASQIQSFLASKGPCLANYSTPNFHWDGSTWHYGDSNWDNSGPANISAATAISQAANFWGFNPQVIIATIEKEESLVSGTSCDGWRYNSAMGYACPDSGGCNSHYAGFTRQILWGSWQLKFNKERSIGNTAWDGDDNITYVGYMTQGSFKRCGSCATNSYDGYATIDGQSIYLENGTTASLYTYTPHLNQSFPGIFEKWFGSTYGLDYAWDFVGVDVSTGSSHVRGNQQATVTVTARNVGNQSWSNSNFPVRLGTWSSTNHNSALYDSSWVGPYRPATLNQSTVLPGDTGTFTFKINPPNINETYDERFNLVAEGSTWFNDPGFDLHLIIDPSYYRWQMVSQSSSTGTFEMTPGSSSTFTLVAKNTGNVTWTNNTNPVRLATWNPTNRQSAFYDSSWISPARPAVMQESSVTPGNNGTFVFTVHAPTTERLYTERFNLAMDGISWMDDPWMEFDVQVDKGLRWQMVSQTSSTGSFAFSAGSTAQLTLVAKNTGIVTWTNSSNPVRLGTWNPTNRQSALYDSSWISPARPAVLQQASVSPGQNGTFVFTIHAPSQTGNFTERFNLAMDGVAWMVDPWMEFDIAVH